ncbi:MAG: TrpF [Deltaproteobacteria bacterium]|nr:TrpF [Deltaproteobacteria bacterium]
MTCSIKICGITSVADARMLSDTGIDYLGVLVNVRQSPRSVGVETAAAIVAAATVPVMALTYDHAIDDVLRMVRAVRPAGVQLAGTEQEHYIAALREKVDIALWKTVHLPASDAGEQIAAELARLINHLSAIGIDRIILDTAITKGRRVMRGGTGEHCDWPTAALIKQRVNTFLFLAGGITPENVRDAVRQVHPDGIDLSSGVERARGKKDLILVRRLIEEAAASVMPQS